ncbi:hypothetical protein GF382_02580 [Candidatus Falkowbacteria bacterium]|nr:hypothetical protein [Candidatus Falkowbacteria bacterium]
MKFEWKRAVIFILVIVLLAFGFFWLKKDKKIQNVSNQPEVLLGSECGFDYLRCCDTEPACSFGQQCCIDPNDPERNYCADECTCGAEEEFCCEGNVCNEGLLCHYGNCRSCGEEGDMCCLRGDACSEGLACLDEQCVACGLDGNPCCQSGDPCIAGKGQRSECLSGICSLCGSKGLRACSQGEECLPGHLYNNNVCFICGNANQPCCNEEAGLGYDCDPKKGLVCDLGFCK